MEESKLHVVVVPALVQRGHLIPFMELAKLLASQGLTVSYITTPGSAKRLQPQVQNTNLNIRFVSLPMPPILGVPPDIDSWDNVPLDAARILVASSHKLAGPFEQWLEQQMYDTKNKIKNTEAPHFSPPPVCIISDMFTGWLHSSGAKFGIPTMVFYTSGAFAMSVIHSLLNYTPKKSLEGDAEIFEVPALSFDLKLRKSDLPVAMQDLDSNPSWNVIREEINRSMQSGRGILINTFYELDSVGIDHIRRLTGRPVWSIGPLLPPAAFDGMRVDRGNMNSRGKTADIDEEECLRWLDSRHQQSVVFVCFGSLFFPNNEQIRALAAGLEASGQAFVWAIRRSQAEPNPKVAEVGLPEGFEDRTRERGLIIWGWAPQLLILSHPSVGAFLTHCGWNSTLESVSLGVPMITWPMFAEQPFNSKLLEEFLGIGIQICLDVSSVPDEEEVRRAVTMLVAEEEGKKMRMRAKELGRLAKLAVDKEGSSYNNLQSFVQAIKKLPKS
jgi:hypothetical protein